MKFSDRYGYTSPNNILKRESLDREAINGICTCYDYLESFLDKYDNDHFINRGESYTRMEEHLWCFFRNERRDDFWEYNGHMIVATAYLEDSTNNWYDKFNLIEFSIEYLRNARQQDRGFQGCVQAFIDLLNSTFKRLNLSYRVINDQIVEITDKEEVISIENALKVSDNVRVHISGALQHLSSRPAPDYRNSIKESISAVEVVCREITGENTLGDAFKKLERKGIALPRMLQVSFEKLYAYTNDKSTGIRHALLEDQENPGFEEAKFMLVACCAFVNYIQAKRVG